MSQQGNLKGSQFIVGKKTLTGTTLPHWHDNFEIEYIVSGGGKYTIDGTEYPIEKGMIFFTGTSSFHIVSLENTTLYNLRFTSEICNSELLTKLCSSPHLVVKVSDENFVLSLFEKLEKNKHNSIYSSAVINYLIAEIGLSSKATQKSSSVSAKAQFYIMNNFRNDIKLEDVANYVNLSPPYFSKIFKEETGINFKKYINEQRFKYARNLIKFSDMNIMQICYESGFSDYANFLRRFKEKFGVSPTEYKKISEFPH